MTQADQSTTGAGTRERIWRNLYRAEVNARYFGLLCPWYAIVERAVAIVSALSASATVTKWAIWTSLPGSLSVFSGATAVLTIITATTNLAGRTTAVVDLRSKWTLQKSAWESAWAKARNGHLVTEDEANAIAKVEADLTKLELGMFVFGGLKHKAQDEACDALGVDRKPRR